MLKDNPWMLEPWARKQVRKKSKKEVEKYDRWYFLSLTIFEFLYEYEMVDNNMKVSELI